MSDIAPPEQPPHDDAPPARDRRIVWTAAVSVLLHAVVVGWLLFPALRDAAEAAPPAAIAVELVPEPVSSSEAVSASETPSSEMPSSIETSSSEAAVSGESSAEQMSSEETSSAPSSAEASSEAASSEALSSAEASSEAASASEAASEEASSQASSEQPVTPMQRPVVIPVGPSEASSELDSSMEDASASASEEPSTADASSAEASSAEASGPSEAVLTADTPNASDGIAEDSSALSESSEEVAALAPPPPADSMLHAAKRYYLDAMLNSPNLARARDALKKLPPERRLVQTCNIEALGQIGNAGHNFEPNAVKADAFGKTVISGSTFTVTNGAFRSGAKWYAIAYKCALSKDLSSVESFSFHIGDEVTDVLLPKLGGN